MSFERDLSPVLTLRLATKVSCLVLWILFKLALVSAFLSQDIAELIYAGF